MVFASSQINSSNIEGLSMSICIISMGGVLHCGFIESWISLFGAGGEIFWCSDKWLVFSSSSQLRGLFYERHAYGSNVHALVDFVF